MKENSSKWRKIWVRKSNSRSNIYSRNNWR